ncbi:cell death abnormality protein 1-like [Crassostrea angulata]|uniref:cell death abnormality protein 1-like n=1 Tax=Magallana angulata TaxID=2784310 RepID=UPI0022B1FB08|nr:cell death abnormality protein 1-like [Crassostrea angulata]
MSHTSGHYEIHLSVGNTAMTLATRCKAFELPGIIQPQQTAIECDAALSGDTFIVKKIDDGPLRLFEVYPIICPSNHFGPNCARCRKSCRSCDSITGVCVQCNGSFYGEYCQHSCPENCLNTTCDQRTGSCNGCVDHYRGKTCKEYIEPNTNRNTLRCNHSFVTCEQNIKVCMLCTSSLMLEKCKYSCEEICSGSSCLEIVDNETVRQCGKEVLFRLFSQV